MELRRYLRLMRHYVLLLAVTTIVGAAVGYFTVSRGTGYTATSTIYVGLRKGGAETSEGLAGFDQILSTYALMIPTYAVAEEAVAAAHVDRTAAQAAAETHASVVTTSAGGATNLIQVTVTDTRPAVATVLADAMAASFTKQLAATPPASAAGVPSEPAVVFADAGAAAPPAAPHHLTRTALGAALGLVLAVLAVLLLDYLDTTVKDTDELEGRVGLPVIGIVPQLDPDEDAAVPDEAFRVVRSNLDVALAGAGHPTVVVTSALDTPTRSRTAAALGRCFAEDGRRVVLVDFDLRPPPSATGGGLSDVLLGRRPLAECLRPASGPSSTLQLLTAGPPVANPATLLGAPRLARLLASLEAAGDVTVLDVAAVLSVADALVLGPVASGVVLTADLRHTGTGPLQRSRDLLLRNRCRLLGVVVSESRRGQRRPGHRAVPEQPRLAAFEEPTPSATGVGGDDGAS